jgi:hypothetical protein
MAQYWLTAGASALAAAWAAYKFVASVRRARMLADTPLVRIRSAAQGYVKVSGRAGAAGEPLLAPLSSRPCIWYRYNVDEKRTNSKGETSWHSADSGTSVHPFILADADGECLVGPINAEITPTTHDVWYGDREKPGTAPPLGGGLLLESHDYRYSERLLSVGDHLCVTGELRSNSDILTADAAAAALLRQWKSDQPALLKRFDSNHDGHIDADEWEKARRAAAAESQQSALNSAIVRTSVIGQPTHGEPFLIAAMDSSHLVQRERLYSVLFFAIGLIAAGSCAWATERALAFGHQAGLNPWYPAASPPETPRAPGPA